MLKRCYATLLPTSSNYLSTHLNPADLYGPFWTLTTLIFTLFLSSSLAASISVYLSAPGTEYDYNFHLLSIAVTLVYAYGLALPVLLWLALRYIGVGEWSVVEAVAIWGYGQFVWIPVSVCPSPQQDIRGTNVLMVDSVRNTCSYSALGSRVRCIRALRIFPSCQCLSYSGLGMFLALVRGATNSISGRSKSHTANNNHRCSSTRRPGADIQGSLFQLLRCR